MLQILSLVAPVFGLITLGFLTAKTGYVSDGAGRVVSETGYKVVMPALLFSAMLAVRNVPVSPMWLVASYLCGIGMIWVLATLVARLVLRRPAEDAPAIAMGTCFSNGVMLGFPIIIQALGPDAATPMAFLATCETLFLWLIGTLHIAVANRGGRGLSLSALVAVVADVARNPLIIAMAAGLLWRETGMALPELAATLIKLLAAAAVPVSLLGLGMSLAAYKIAGQAPTIGAILILKMLVYPLIAAVLAVQVFALPPLWAAALIIYVSMPVGANAFLFAARYDKAVASVSAAIAISTLLAVVTVSATLWVLQANGLMPPV